MIEIKALTLKRNRHRADPKGGDPQHLIWCRNRAAEGPLMPDLQRNLIEFDIIAHRESRLVPPPCPMPSPPPADRDKVNR